MIAKFIKKTAGSNRGQAAGLIKYIFGATKDKDKIAPKHEHSGTKEKIHYIGSSDNICVVNPLTAIVNSEIVKLNGSEADLSEIITTFNDSESKNQRAKYPLEHIVLALQPGEELEIDKWGEAVKMFMEEMGYGDCTWVSCLHEDTESIHAHIAFCNISNEPPHNSINPSEKFQMAAKVRTEIEKKFGLNHTVSPFIDRVAVRNPKLKKNQIRNHIRVSIDEILHDNSEISSPDFMLAMQEKGIGTFASLKNQETEIQGLSFSVNGQKVRAGSLGNGYKTKDLFERGVTYDYVRDIEQVTELNTFEQQRCAMYDGIKGECERLINADHNGSSYILPPQTKVERAIRNAEAKLYQDYYVVSILHKDDIADTYQNLQTRSYSRSSIATAIQTTKEASSVSDMLHSIAVDPWDKDGERTRARIAKMSLAQTEAKVERERQKLLQIMMSLFATFFSARPSRFNKMYNPYTKNYRLPRRGWDMGPLLNERLDASPVVILTKREMAEQVLLNRTLKVHKNIEDSYERFVMLSSKSQPIFIDRPRFGYKSKFGKREIELDSPFLR